MRSTTILVGVMLWASTCAVARADSANPTCRITFGVYFGAQNQSYGNFDGTITMDPVTNDFAPVTLNTPFGDSWSGSGGYFGNVATIYFPSPQMTLYFNPTLGNVYFLGGFGTRYPHQGSVQCDPPAQFPGCDVFVQHAYTDFFGHPPSDQSRDFYGKVCHAGNSVAKFHDSILLHFYQSPAAQSTSPTNRYFTYHRLQCGDFVKNLYRGFVFREPDPNDPTYVTQAGKQCRSGPAGLAQVAQDIIAFPEYAQKHNPLVIPPDWNAICSGGVIQDDGTCFPFSVVSTQRTSTPTPTPILTPVPPLTAYCHPGENPAYQFGFAALNERLSNQMGKPKSCEYGDPNGSGDTLQDTETGLAFYRQHSNAPTFTNGRDHWALTASGLLHWIGESVDPPEEAELVQD